MPEGGDTRSRRAPRAACSLAHYPDFRPPGLERADAAAFDEIVSNVERLCHGVPRSAARVPQGGACPGARVSAADAGTTGSLYIRSEGGAGWLL